MNYLKLNETRHMTLYGPQYFLVCLFFLNAQADRAYRFGLAREAVPL